MFSLKSVLRMNAASCILFGVLFVFMPSVVADFLSPQFPAPSLLVLALGTGLVANGAHLLWASYQVTLNKPLVYHFSFGDFIWTIVTVVLIASELWITTTAGIATALVIAFFVALFGVLQLVQFSRDVANTESF